MSLATDANATLQDDATTTTTTPRPKASRKRNAVAKGSATASEGGATIAADAESEWQRSVWWENFERMMRARGFAPSPEGQRVAERLPKAVRWEFVSTRDQDPVMAWMLDCKLTIAVLRLILESKCAKRHILLLGENATPSAAGEIAQLAFGDVEVVDVAKLTYDFVAATPGSRFEVVPFPLPAHMQSQLPHFPVLLPSDPLVVYHRLAPGTVITVPSETYRYYVVARR